MKCKEVEGYDDRTEANKARTAEALGLLKRAWYGLVGVLNGSNMTLPVLPVMYYKGGSDYCWDASEDEWNEDESKLEQILNNFLNRDTSAETVPKILKFCLGASFQYTDLSGLFSTNYSDLNTIQSYRHMIHEYVIAEMTTWLKLTLWKAFRQSNLTLSPEIVVGVRECVLGECGGYRPVILPKDKRWLMYAEYKLCD